MVDGRGSLTFSLAYRFMKCNHFSYKKHFCFYLNKKAVIEEWLTAGMGYVT